MTNFDQLAITNTRNFGFLEKSKRRAHQCHNDTYRKILLDTTIYFWYNTSMKNEIATKMSPEGLEIANSYLEHGSIPAVCADLGVQENEVSEMLNKRESNSI